MKFNMKSHALPAAPGGKMVNAFNPATAVGLKEKTRALVERRARLLGPAYRLFYQNPVEVSTGKGVLLWDSDGNEYLDAYNNVVSVGHAHPRVVAAVHDQMQKLCTHTRYLQDGILRYAEELLGTFGGTIGSDGHAMFTCTGSEANDLALRIAQHHTGKRGIIVTAEAYHGNSHLTAGFSPSLGENSPLGTWVRQVAAPDSYRIPAKQLGELMAADVARQIVDLERHGDGLAAFIVDSMFSSDGVYGHPTNLLAPVAQVVRNAGGLFIADEVQSGFCRTGERFWGYQRHGVDPDIVTMGKPMGNGFPVAGIAVTSNAVQEFGSDIRYFNTFGGNTVAIAAAQATFDVIREERLLENSDKVGRMIREGISAMASRFELIGDVRGSGLYIGVELVADRNAKTPDAAAAVAVVNGLRERRVLISATGFHGNTLKIRPPLVFGEQHVDRLLTELESVLAQVSR
jgi:4-aminobutyrate aminotransferase-like enzyme